MGVGRWMRGDRDNNEDDKCVTGTGGDGEEEPRETPVFFTRLTRFP